jgi:hypothetical protein
VGAETVKIFATLELDLDATAPGSVSLLTDLPGTAMALRYTALVPATARRPVRFRLAGITKGHLLQLLYLPGAGASHVYGARVYARELPAGAWQWYDLRVPATPDVFTAVPLPIPPTEQDWKPVPLPVPPTPQEWTATPLPVPAIGDWKPVPLPIPPTEQNWQAVALPFQKTPPLPDWVEIPVDE